MIRTPGQRTTHYGIGYYTGETVVQFQCRKRRQEIAQLLEALIEKHPTGTIYVVWDNANTHEDEDIDAVVQAAQGRLVLLYLPTYSPWLNPIEMLWRHFRREVTHCELFESMQALLAASQDFFDRYNLCPEKILSVIDSHAAKVVRLYLSCESPSEPGSPCGPTSLRKLRSGSHQHLFILLQQILAIREELKVFSVCLTRNNCDPL